jgi:hypothetical protein
VFGLLKPELEFAIEKGGNALMEEVFIRPLDLQDLIYFSMFDLDRGSFV